MVDLIAKKREGETLSSQELRWMLTGYLGGDIPDYQVSAWLMAVCWQGMTAAETTALTLALAESGQMLDLGELTSIAADKHSTGGVGDKTTLIVAPLVASVGVPIAKLSGRALGFTGGTLDKLESIPGFRTNLSTEEFREILGRVGVVVSSQTAELAPADGKLYSLRDVTATVESIPLIASSVMSKKLAGGAGTIVLDVKAGRGAFMKTVEMATELARMMVEIGRGANRKMAAIVSSMSQPLGMNIGNALEVKEAIATLRGEGPRDLTELCLTLGATILEASGRAPVGGAARRILEESIKSGQALAKLRELIEAQGGDARVIDSPDILPKAPIVEPILADRSGFVTNIDALEVGLTVSEMGAGRAKKGDEIDPGVGVVCLAKVGQRVKSGVRLAEIHASSQASLDRARERLSRAWVIGDERPEETPLIYTIVR